MLIKRLRGWEAPGRDITPEEDFFSRRAAMTSAAVIGGAIAVGGLGITAARADAPPPGIPASAMRYKPGRALTAQKVAETYNNFYEFSTDKDLWQMAQSFPQRPWSIAFDGMVEKPFTIAIDDLLKQMPIEERVYRHRCVEAWAMTVPWTGFALSKLVALAKPTAGAKYIVFTSDADPKVMPGLGGFMPWPYVEALTLAEANNELAFIGTGLYGKPMPPQNGGPIRLVTPWKYGFKSGKSIVKISFADKQPDTFWAQLAPDEYGFWANVNPAFPHPRWSQAQERLIGTDQVVDTQIYNGYGQWAASLYAGMPQTRKLFM
ncbi:protein-methionine-sulfoxide reductase catalytic subunit MsrP [Acidisoma cellulosilytica]|uniref:Protein-methionine-sulfoxide reductase catalytic subunit MsrP n=1 Tax=Acidisoma cellulosilyticum TaxID=2802395 RepID=A0A963YYK1_9PROT|nr:protein-methionine-sulfoxide reductase catalytic subunit MsrP [Acidisoma cellulosilyticum]MCB8879514.1 protein-methionine-sulfoxide reductase catalytic subunit MsrP [Acidisoma cellulosilyticum]